MQMQERPRIRLYRLGIDKRNLNPKFPITQKNLFILSYHYKFLKP